MFIDAYVDIIQGVFTDEKINCGRISVTKIFTDRFCEFFPPHVSSKIQQIYKDLILEKIIQIIFSSEKNGCGGE